MAATAARSVKKLSFTVDAALLEELGQRLIGRPYIALAELVKNAYDADARLCEIRFEEDAIEVVDDGHGMSPDEFENLWMRIASTHKMRQESSREFNRPLTGSKGIGRLSVLFLAQKMTLITRAKRSREVLEASADWRQVVPGEDLQTVLIDYEIRPRNDEAFADGKNHGVRIRLEGLRDSWSGPELTELARQLWMLQPPFLEFSKDAGGEGFKVDLDADDPAKKKAFEKASTDILDRNWRARVIGRVRRSGKRGAATVRVEFKEGFGAPWADTEIFDLPFPLYPSSDEERAEEREETSYIDLAHFEIRVYRRRGRQAGGIKLAELIDYLNEFGGVGIFDASFRLPYYNREDWLDIERDYSRRINVSKLLPENIREETRAMLDLPPRQNLLGVVLINTGRERKTAEKDGIDLRKVLTINPSRDRLTHNAGYDQLRYIVRASIDLYANHYRKRVLASEEVELEYGLTSKQERRLKTILGELRGTIDDDTADRIDKAVKAYTSAAKKEADGLRRSMGVYGAIATAGMNAVAFSHELSREMRTLDSIVTDLRALGKKKKSEEIVASADRLAKSTKSIGALRGLFSLVVDASNREQVRKFSARVVLEETIASMRRLLPGIEINVDGVPKNLLLPPGTMAEWSALFQNVLSNAWNAMLESAGKTILFEGESDGKNRYIWISDQGKGLGVDLDEATDLFEPFQRKLEVTESQKPRMIGGQGVGLAIVRMIAEARGAEVGFVEPDPGFETCFKLAWREK